MSNLYVTEPATNGKVVVETTAGDIEIELWGRECPKAVRNFIALSMEGYYDGVIFHRLVPGFIIQTGDPTGTGTGGDSFYGEPFADEIHGRLKFNRRGLVGMANRSQRNTNTSQWFITLDKAEELTGRHTMFGQVMGNTIYNVVDMGQLEIDAEERPLHPPRIKTIRIIENPFPDIVPRITAAERRAQQQARLDAKRDLEQREKRAKAKKNTGLLSFGEAEEIPEEAITVKKKGITRTDLVDPADVPKKPVESYVELPESLKGLANGKKEERKAVDLKAIRAKHEKEKMGDEIARQAEIRRMEDSLRALKKRQGNDSDSDSDSSTRRKRRKGPSYLEQELSKYAAGRGRAAARSANKRGRRDEEEDLLLQLGEFTKRVAAMGEESPREEAPEEPQADKSQEEGEMITGDTEGLETDDDVGWMKHQLKFIVDEKELTRRAEDEYAVIDPRAKARQLAQEHSKEKEGQRRGTRTVADVGRRK
ncbi:peptidyl-prolyl isomerase CWC27 [Tremella mesenterica]|uniref:Peptidyl-prolyl isomerase CWC27 n=1 Tax=Tremella mesenterica TaxID=5217 RepID=A0A4Q1BMV3_TREME|nr:peptidyl-prolyl isomerase CWC27 [Tremella mesenterica]